MTSITAPHTTQDTCRSCGSKDLVELIAFGNTPIADRLVSIGTTEPQYVAPLTLVTCQSCSLCQIKETVDPKILFPPDYPYYSSVSPALVAHFHQGARDLISSGMVAPGARVLEAASNDGYLLEVFKDAGFEVLGIDPADGPASVAIGKGIETLTDFFGLRVAQDLVAQDKTSDLFLANNVLAHVADTNDFVAGIATVLSADGIAVIECPYLLEMVKNGAFDTIYHQHLLFLSLTALVPLFERHGLFLNEARLVKVHGGSLRLFISRTNTRSARLNDMLAHERQVLADPRFYGSFLGQIEKTRQAMRRTLSQLKADGKKVAGYGATAKATTLMQHFGIDRSDIAFIVDKSPWKQGMEMPGTGIPIVAQDRIAAERPDVIVLLAWNFANEIMSENSDFLDRGGRFLIPVPELREVAADYEGVSF